VNLADLPLTLPVWSDDENEFCVGRLLGISRGLAYESVRRGDIKSVRLGRTLRVPRRALLELLGEPDPLQRESPASRAQGSLDRTSNDESSAHD